MTASAPRRPRATMLPPPAVEAAPPPSGPRARAAAPGAVVRAFDPAVESRYQRALVACAALLDVAGDLLGNADVQRRALAVRDEYRAAYAAWTAEWERAATEAREGAAVAAPGGSL